MQGVILKERKVMERLGKTYSFFRESNILLMMWGYKFWV